MATIDKVVRQIQKCPSSSKTQYRNGAKSGVLEIDSASAMAVCFPFFFSILFILVIHVE
jgi:hypothetical protein